MKAQIGKGKVTTFEELPVVRELGNEVAVYVNIGWGMCKLSLTTDEAKSLEGSLEKALLGGPPPGADEVAEDVALYAKERDEASGKQVLSKYGLDLLRMDTGGYVLTDGSHIIGKVGKRWRVDGMDAGRTMKDAVESLRSMAAGQ